MKTITLKSQEAQFIYSILAKVHLRYENDLSAWNALIVKLEPNVKKFEKKAGVVIDAIKTLNEDLRTANPKDEAFEKIEKTAKDSIKKEQEKFKVFSDENQEFTFEDQELIDLNWFLTDYVKAWTKYDASPEMKGMLNIPSLKIIYKVMCECSDAIEAMKSMSEDKCEDAEG